MRTINPKFAKVVLDASREAFNKVIGPTNGFDKLTTGLIAQIIQINSNSGHTRMTCKEFDEASYQIFLEGLKYVKNKKTIDKITQRIGKKIFEYFKKNNKFLLTGNPDDIKSWRTDLGKLLKCLIHIGYLEDGKIIWKSKKEFLYQMKDPVILPSATKLYNRYGIAQHYSSRTIEALFATYQIRARENPDFNPNKYSKDLVIEQWTIEKLI